MKIKKGDKVIVKKTGQAGVVTGILPNPYFPEWLCSPNYLVSIDKDNTGASVFTKKQLKKPALLIMLLIMFCSCNTYNVYLSETKLEPVYTAPAKYSENRFTSSFQKSDSLFEKASKEAAKAAYEKTKHLSKLKRNNMYKVLIRYESGAWVEVKSGYNREEIEDYAVTKLVNKEYMVVSVLRHHSGEPEEFQI